MAGDDGRGRLPSTPVPCVRPVILCGADSAGYTSNSKLALARAKVKLLEGRSLQVPRFTCLVEAGEDGRGRSNIEDALIA